MPSVAKDKLGLKAEVFRSMGHPIRLGIIEFLETGEHRAREIAETLGTQVSNVFKHLSVLKKAGVVEDRRQGRESVYSLAMPCVLDFSRVLEGIILRRIEKQRAIVIA